MAFVDGAFHGGPFVVGEVHRSRQGDESVAEVLLGLKGADVVFDGPELGVDLAQGLKQVVCRSPLSRAALSSRIVILSTTSPIEAGICKLAGLGDTACEERPTMEASPSPCG